MPRKRKRLRFLLPHTESVQDDAASPAAHHVFVILAHLLFLAGIALWLSPLIALHYEGETGALLMAMVVLVTSPATVYALKHYKQFSPSALWQSLLFLGRHAVVRGIALLVLNVLLFLRIGLQTLIPTLSLLELYALLTLLFFILTREEVFKHKTLTGLWAAPLLLNLLLCINYWFASRPVKEMYMIHWNYERVRGGMQRSSLVSLSDNAYSAYPGIRVFWDFESLSRARKVTYTFETGLLGIKVMKDYTFN